MSPGSFLDLALQKTEEKERTESIAHVFAELISTDNTEKQFPSEPFVGKWI
jgi:hypothetical protein